MPKSVNHHNHHQFSSGEGELYDDNSTKITETVDCENCDSLRQMLYVREKTIMKLAEDRDEMKIKLTKTMNMNIELTRQLMKYHTLSREKMQNIRNESVASGIMPRSPIISQLKDDAAELKRKCIELDHLYQTFKANINTHRAYVYNSDLIITPEKSPQPMAQSHVNNGPNYETEAELSSTSSVSHNFEQDLPVEDHNNNSSQNRNQFQRTSSPIDDLKPEIPSPKPASMLSDIHDQPQAEVSSFDLWYNS